jgi:hypothetical protein
VQPGRQSHAKLLASGGAAGTGDAPPADGAAGAGAGAVADGAGPDGANDAAEQRAGLRAVKRNLLSLYGASEAGPAGAGADAGVAGTAPAALAAAAHAGSPPPPRTDVDLARWASASRGPAMSPVPAGRGGGVRHASPGAGGGRAPSPVPVVLQHRVVGRSPGGTGAEAAAARLGESPLAPAVAPAELPVASPSPEAAAPGAGGGARCKRRLSTEPGDARGLAEPSVTVPTLLAPGDGGGAWRPARGAAAELRSEAGASEPLDADSATEGAEGRGGVGTPGAARGGGAGASPDELLLRTLRKILRFDHYGQSGRGGLGPTQKRLSSSAGTSPADGRGGGLDGSVEALSLDCLGSLDRADGDGASGDASTHSFVEGMSLMEAFDHYDLDAGLTRGLTSPPLLVGYVSDATPTGEPSRPIAKSLGAAFDACAPAPAPAPRRAAEASSPPEPVAKSLFGAFEAAAAESPGGGAGREAKQPDLAEAGRSAGAASACRAGHGHSRALAWAAEQEAAGASPEAISVHVSTRAGGNGPNGGGAVSLREERLRLAGARGAAPAAAARTAAGAIATAAPRRRAASAGPVRGARAPGGALAGDRRMMVTGRDCGVTLRPASGPHGPASGPLRPASELHGTASGLQPLEPWRPRPASASAGEHLRGGGARLNKDAALRVTNKVRPRPGARRGVGGLCPSARTIQ